MDHRWIRERQLGVGAIRSGGYPRSHRSIVGHPLRVGHEAPDLGPLQATPGLAGEQPALEQLDEQLPGDPKLSPTSYPTISTADRRERIVEASSSFAIARGDRRVHRCRRSRAGPAGEMKDEAMDTSSGRRGLEWQIGVWDRISQLYVREVDPRFAPVVQNVLRRGGLQAGDRVLDLGTGTGSVAIGAAALVGSAGRVTGVDISPDMLGLARRRVVESGRTNVDLREGRAEQLPAEDGSVDVLLASLSLMYVIDRGVAAREIRRVLRPDARFVAAVWAAAEQCDIVLFQLTARRFVTSPPVPGIRHGALSTRAVSL